MKSKIWVAGYFVILTLILGVAGKAVYEIDPFFHYHKPNIGTYYYHLTNQRSQNDGITKHFDYDALITGTSMTENFKTSEMDTIFGTTSIKVPYSGGSYKEINDNLRNALRNNPSLKIIIRCLDMDAFFLPSDRMRDDLGEYPTYLYDSNPLNDVKYLLNRSVVFDRVYSMQKARRTEGFIPGITSFDDYANWQARNTFGAKTVIPEGIDIRASGDKNHITEEEKLVIHDNIYKNVISLAQEYPHVTFYYFFSPYNAAWWAGADICHQIEGERYVIELILECDNIKLFSFNMRTDITTDLNNYTDGVHYAGWINSLMLKWMHEGKYQLTKDNYEQYLEDELNFYTSFDYESLNQQEDYEDDLYAAALLNQELSGVKPISLLPDKNGERLKVRDTELASGGTVASQATLNIQYAGDRILIEGADGYKYLFFSREKSFDDGYDPVIVYDGQGDEIARLANNDEDPKDVWHQYVVDISNADGNIVIDNVQDFSNIFNEVILY